MIRTLLVALFAGLAAAPARALTAKVDRIDGGTSYLALADTESVKYLDHCTRGKFEPYEWKTWEGYYSARAYVMPIAIITVKRDKAEMFGGDVLPFINRAKVETKGIGGNLLCFVQVKKNKQILEPDVIVFRAYKQLYQAGNEGWEAFFKDIMDQGVLLTLQDLQLGEKTREALERHQPVKKPTQ